MIKYHVIFVKVLLVLVLPGARGETPVDKLIREVGEQDNYFSTGKKSQNMQSISIKSFKQRLHKKTFLLYIGSTSQNHISLTL